MLVPIPAAAVLLLFCTVVQAKSRVVTVCRNDHGDYETFEGRRKNACHTPLATAKLDNKINATGWGFLEVETTGQGSLLEQAYAAGVAEGQVTRELIYANLLNTVDGYCDGAKEFCQRLGVFLEKNFLWMAAQIFTHPNDPYWQHVNVTMEQLRGLLDGYEQRRLSLNEITVHPIYMLQLMGDHDDLEVKLHKPPNPLAVRRGNTHCSALIKPAPGNKELLVSHVTWTSYSSMLRLQKVYKFGSSSCSSFPGYIKSMSGYPGTLASIDDFVLLSSGLAVTETTIENHNLELYKFTTPSTILSWIRSQIAHRLANSGKEWAEIFSKYNSGTYNNQWMVIDYKLFTPGQPLPAEGLLYVLEQMPGYVEHSDRTHVLKDQGYWPSYNRAYYERIFNISNCWPMVQKFGDYYSYSMAPRGRIFRRDQHTVVDMKSLQRMMRYNDYTNDPLSRCSQCNPPYSADLAISARNDLNPQNGSYPFGDLAFKDEGATDMKATNSVLMKKLRFRAIAGPTYDQVPAFNWKTSPLRDVVKHFAQPDLWRFDPIVHPWSRGIKMTPPGDTDDC
uniref:Phospholipase B-like n=1 Tax=Plectus sambesii TaxID=2011161 RepID=A0A914UZU6_9BILA